MSVHPLVLAVWLGDLLALILALDAARRIVTCLPGWDAVAGDRDQLARERSLEMAAFEGEWVFVLQAAVLIMTVVGCSIVWSDVVPGAMCGTGVLQSMGTAGWQSLLFRAAALIALYAWRSAAGINRRSAQGALSPMMGRLFLFALPLMLLATAAWGRAVAAVDPGSPVDCCAVVYAAAAGESTPETPDAGSDSHMWIVLCTFGAIAVAVSGILRRSRPLAGGTRFAGLLVLITLGWAALAVHALQIGFGPYIYQVLRHPCPWCFFLPEHHGVGFLLYGSLSVVCAEQVAACTAVAAGRNAGLMPAAIDRLRSAQLRVAAATVVFCATALLPVLRWRIQFGGWMY
jgi:hypothetical protein